MQDMDGNPIGMTPKQLAHRIGVTEETLYNWRRRRQGPPFFKISGVIYYRPDDVSEWIRSKRVA
jgi:predicted DNA-binding transcriptional regulator AlpA